MSTTLEIEFPWGRYHATPWDRSTNEGTAEWPPSPWRLLRALYSAWKIHNPQLGESTVVPLLERLTATPTFVLPRHVESHTRHYLPGVDHKRYVKTQTDKTLDSFIAFERGSAVFVTWAVDLSADEIDLLRELVSGIRYLGRAESIVTVRVVDHPGEGVYSEPGLVEEDGSLEPVLAPVESATATQLAASPADVRKARRRIPDGSKLVVYHRPRPTSPPVLPAAQLRRDNATAVRLSVTGRPLPSRREAVALGHLLHAAAVKKSDPRHSPQLSGCDVDARPLGGTHGHAHFLAIPQLDDLSAPRVDSLLVWARDGLTDEDVDALAKLESLQMRNVGRHTVRIVDSGPVEQVAPELVGPSSIWASVTPYSPIHRHKGTLEAQLLKDVNRQLEHYGRSERCSDLTVTDGSWLSYRRYRPSKERLGQQRPAYGLRLVFDEPVAGPLVLGQLSHFGLGLFRPIG